MIFVIFCIILYILRLKSKQKVVFASKNWFWPANGMRSTRLLVKIHNRWQKKITKSGLITWTNLLRFTVNTVCNFHIFGHTHICSGLQFTRLKIFGQIYSPKNCVYSPSDTVKLLRFSVFIIRSCLQVRFGHLFLVILTSLI